jgi:hypothetical protein
VSFLSVQGGIIVSFFQKSPTPLCKSCVHRYFWNYTLLTALCGWWSIRALLWTPIILLNNVLQYIGCCFTLKPVPRGATAPQLTPQAIQRLRPHAQAVAGALKKGIEPVQIAFQVAPVAGVTPGQVMRFIWTKEFERQLKINAGFLIEIGNEKVAS